MKLKKNVEWGSGQLFREILKGGKLSYATNFGSKSTTVLIEKYPILKNTIYLQNLL
jgi:hypothetical protein